MAISLGGAYSQSDARSREEMKSEYEKTIRTPETMAVPDWAKTMTEEFMRSFYGPEYYEQISYKEADEKVLKRIKIHERRVKYYGGKAEASALAASRATGAAAAKHEAAATKYANLRDKAQVELEAHKPEAIGEYKTPYEEAIERTYGEVRGRKEDIRDYMEAEKGLIPGATKEAVGRYSDLLGTMVERSLAGESVAPQIGLPDTGFAGLLDRLTKPVSMGLEGYGGMSFVPKGAAEAMREAFAGRESALDQLRGWGATRAEQDVIPAYTQYQYGLAPKEYALGMAEQTPEAGALLQQLAGMRGMWQPVESAAMQYGAQVPLTTETEEITSAAKAASSAMGAGYSGSIG